MGTMQGLVECPHSLGFQLTGPAGAKTPDRPPRHSRAASPGGQRGGKRKGGVGLATPCFARHFCLAVPWQPRDGEPIVTQLHPGPIIVQDGHFSQPLGSTDLLRAPAHFPVPSSRVVLREVSFVWHLYGGRDFGLHPAYRLEACGWRLVALRSGHSLAMASSSWQPQASCVSDLEFVLAPR